jgi:hypothetical protein
MFFNTFPPYPSHTMHYQTPGDGKVPALGRGGVRRRRLPLGRPPRLLQPLARGARKVPRVPGILQGEHKIHLYALQNPSE